MDKDLFDFSFEEIVNDEETAHDERTERLIEIKRYEKLYLLKSKSDAELPLSDIPDEERILLFKNVVFSGFKRFYIEDLTERDYSLEGCTPYQLFLDDIVIEEGSWGDLLCKTAARLLDVHPEKKVDIEGFRAPWTKAAMFSSVQKTNFKMLEPNLYLNCNHTALHSCWLLQDLFDYFEIDRAQVRLLIHRPCCAEKRDLKQFLEKEFKRGFKNYLCISREKTIEYADKVVANIEKYLNPILESTSKSYPNFFLFDDTTIVSGYTNKVKSLVVKSIKFDDKAKKILCKYLDYLLAFYKI